jgi:cysteine desulfurase/selenocysteine lyase
MELGGVTPDHVEYNELPWKFAAGTPNILGTIVSAQAMRLLIDLALTPDQLRRFEQTRPLQPDEIREGMNRISDYTRGLTGRAFESLAGRDPMGLAEALGRQGIESRAGCHCATLAHRFLNLDPPASCRLSFYFYNTADEVDCATDAVAFLARTAAWA